MAFFTIQPTVNQTPDPALVGDIAVNVPTNTGHAGTLTVSSVSASPPFGTASQGVNRSCRWSSFGSVSGQIKDITLKFDWSVDNRAAAAASNNPSGSAFSAADFFGQYSINAGVSYVDAISRSVSAFGKQIVDPPLETGSVSVSISNAIALNQIIVRDRMITSADADAGEFTGSTASGRTDVSISNIRLEVETFDPVHPVIMM